MGVVVGERNRKPTRKQCIKVGFLSISSCGVRKKWLRRSSNSTPSPRERPARPKRFLTDIARRRSSKCPFTIPWLQPSSCPHALALLFCLFPVLLFLPTPRVRKNHHRKTCCNTLSAFLRKEYMWQTCQNNWLPFLERASPSQDLGITP